MSLHRMLRTLLAAALLWVGPAWIAYAQTMRVHVIDVGQGAATLVEFPCAAILVDTGGESNEEFKSDDALIAYLDAFFARRADLNKTLQSLILTHPHVDHTRGVKRVISRYKIRNAVTNGTEPKDQGGTGQRALHAKVADSEEDDDPATRPIAPAGASKRNSTVGWRASRAPRANRREFGSGRESSPYANRFIRVES